MEKVCTLALAQRISHTGSIRARYGSGDVGRSFCSVSWVVCFKVLGKRLPADRDQAAS